MNTGRKIQQKQKPRCSIESCERFAVARSFCYMHWQRWKRHGDPEFKINRNNFWDHVIKQGQDICWIWTGSTKGTAPNKYGSFWFRNASWTAHRVSWVMHFGDIPEIAGADYRGTCVLHRCDNPLCVNPNHLFLGTHQDNVDDKMMKRRDNTSSKTHCRHGHLRTPDNLYTSKNGLRQCRECGRIRWRKYEALRRLKELSCLTIQPDI